MTTPTTPSTATGRPWRLALAWLAGLGPFFYLSYGWANLLAAQRADVPSLVFAWERGMPFVPWSIVPYWTLNLFYAAALFLPATRAGVNALGRQLLTAQVVAVGCFVLFPLRYSFTRPPVEGVPGFLFDVLMGFDQPFNQAPSLHIALGVILWAAWSAAVPRGWRLALHLWFFLIGVSVLTTYQHHAIDIPTGALLGALCLWLWPNPAGQETVAHAWPGLSSSRRWRLGGAYVAGALACGAAAWALGLGRWPAAGLLVWLGVDLLLVASHYLVRGPGGFQKDAQGRMPPVLQALFAPYLLLARLNAWAWNRGQPPVLAIVDGVHLGPLPRRLADAPGHAVVDLCAELPVRPDPAPGVPAAGLRYRSVPCLDLLPPSQEALHQAAQLIEAARVHGPVRVCCALGRSRSAMAVAAWLLLTGRAADVDAAVDRVRAGQPRLALGPAHRRALQSLRAVP